MVRARDLVNEPVPTGVRGELTFEYLGAESVKKPTALNIADDEIDGAEDDGLQRGDLDRDAELVDGDGNMQKITLPQAEQRSRKGVDTLF